VARYRRTLTATALVALAALIGAALATAAAKPGKYAGTTSEKSSVSFTVSAGGKSVNGFTATDGYNSKCHFHGGLGGIPNFSVKIASMKVAAGGTFTATRTVKLGPFSAKITVKGKLTGSSARGTLNQVGRLCGKGATNPSTPDYLETFTAKRAA
jgi:hypothetical protein